MSATLRRPATAGAPHEPDLTGLAGRKSLRIGVIGAGRVGPVFAAALGRAGHRITAVRGRQHTRDAVRHSDIVLVAVPDDTLGRLVADLAESGALRPGQVVVHTSGAHGVGVLQPAAARGVHVIALHPAMTFSGRLADDLSRLAGCSFGVTTGSGGHALAQRLVQDLGGTAEWIDEADRALYHTALAHGANHLVTLVNEALDRLRDAGVRDPEHVLSPLLHAALDNTLRLGDAALTGPVSRGDAGTVAKHLDALARVAPDSVPSYLALARRTADRAIAAGRLRPVDAESLLDVLASQRAAA